MCKHRCCDAFQTKLQELERRYEAQKLRHDEVTLEVDHLRQEAERARQIPPTDTARVQTDLDTSNSLRNSTATLMKGTRLHDGNIYCV